MGEAVVRSMLGELSSQLSSSLFGEIKLVCGVKGEFQRLNELLSSLECAILDSEMQTNRSNQERDRVKKLEDLVEDIKLVVDDFQTEAKRQLVENRFTDKVTRICSRPAFLYKMSHRMQNIRKRLNDIASNSEALNFSVPDQNTSLVHTNLSRETTSFLGESADVFGRDDDKERIVHELIGNSSTERLSVIPIVGMGGLGKTTLAQLVYDDERVKQVFDMRKWVYVPKHFELHDMIKRIIGSLELSTDASLQDLKDLLQEKLMGKRLFIVLDDVWNIESLRWDQLRNLLLVSDVGSKVIVTTQDENIAKMITSMPYIDRLELLTEKATWDVFKRWACRSGEEWDQEIIEEIEKLVVEKCKGLPLAAKALGMALSTKEVDEWLSLLKGRVWETGQGEHYVTRVIRFSFDQLPSYMKRCFLYSAVHGKQSFSKDDLIHQWMAQDMIPVSDNDQLEDKGNQIVNELSARCFFHNIRYVDSLDNTFCDMHNSIYELARSALGLKFSEINLATENIPAITRYVQLYDSSNAIPKFPKSLLKLNKLQTFVWLCGNVDSSSPIRDISPIFSSFLSLRTLDLVSTSFEVLPRTIERLRHLRYFRMHANNDIKGLPSSICKLYNLQTLSLAGLENLEKLPEHMWKLISLRHLYITSRQNSLPEKGIGCLTSLRKLSINCKFLSSLPNSFQKLTNLVDLRIWCCPELSFRETNLQKLWNLQRLSISDVPKLREIPVGLQDAAPTLKFLSISICSGLAALPEWLENFESLEEVRVEKCPNLTSLPKGMRRLTTLRELHITEGSPELMRRCQQGTGEDWPKIAHVPKIFLGGNLITPRRFNNLVMKNK